MKNTKVKASITEGPIFLRLMLFTLPIILTGLLQVIYNISDNIVVGRFSGDELALAAVGSTGTLTTFIVTFLTGLSTGSGVNIAQAFGSGDKEKTSRAIHTGIGLSLVSGFAFAAIALILSEPALVLIKTKPELMSRALLYFRIICLGVPATTFYNFGNAALRSVGDSKTPLFVLSISGLLNVILNLFFVIVCGMAVEGVALATIISQYCSAVAVFVVLCKTKDPAYRLNPRKIRIEIPILKRILRIGLPTAFQSSLFSISNIILSSAVNTLPTVAVSARTIAFNIDGLLYTAMDGFHHAALTFVGQNYGARKPERIKKSMLYALCQVTAVGLTVGVILLSLCPQLVSLYLDPADPNREAVAAEAVALSSFILSCYFMCGIMNTLNGSLRGLGNSLTPMVIGIVSGCVIRIVWVYTCFPLPLFNSLKGLYYCYPISWAFAIAALFITLLFTWRRVKRKLASGEDI